MQAAIQRSGQRLPPRQLHGQGGTQGVPFAGPAARQPLYITCLRDPVRRVLSEYSWGLTRWCTSADLSHDPWNPWPSTLCTSAAAAAAAAAANGSLASKKEALMRWIAAPNNVAHNRQAVYFAAGLRAPRLDTSNSAQRGVFCLFSHTRLRDAWPTLPESASLWDLQREIGGDFDVARRAWCTLRHRHWLVGVLGHGRSVDDLVAVFRHRIGLPQQPTERARRLATPPPDDQEEARLDRMVSEVKRLAASASAGGRVRARTTARSPQSSGPIGQGSTTTPMAESRHASAQRDARAGSEADDHGSGTGSGMLGSDISGFVLRELVRAVDFVVTTVGAFPAPARPLARPPLEPSDGHSSGDSLALLQRLDRTSLLEISTRNQLDTVLYEAARIDFEAALQPLSHERHTASRTLLSRAKKRWGAHSSARRSRRANRQMVWSGIGAISTMIVTAGLVYRRVASAWQTQRKRRAARAVRCESRGEVRANQAQGQPESVGAGLITPAFTHSSTSREMAADRGRKGE